MGEVVQVVSQSLLVGLIALVVGVGGLALTLLLLRAIGAVR